MSLNNQAQNLPPTPPGTTNFNFSYFNTAWGVIAQVINGNALVLNNLIAQVAAIVIPSPSPTPTAQTLKVTRTDVTSSRVFGTVYQNPTKGLMNVEGHGNAVVGSLVATLTSFVDTVNPPTATGWADEFTATVAGAPAGFSFTVPPQGFYKITSAGDVSSTPGKWFETTTVLS